MATRRVSRQARKSPRKLSSRQPSGRRGGVAEVSDRSDTSYLLACLSDVHFPAHHPGAVTNTLEWVRYRRPRVVVLDGDIIDLPGLARFDPEDNASMSVKDEILMALAFIDELISYGCKVVMLPGNHEARFRKAVIGAKGPVLAGLGNLSLEASYRHLGLPDEVQWISEKPGTPGLWFEEARLLIRHGDKQAKGFGCANVAVKGLRENPGINLVVGHHHRAQLQCQTVMGRTFFSVANPHLSGEHAYASSPDWQRGFSYYEFSPDRRIVTPHLVIMQPDGYFIDGGREYGSQ